MESNLDRTLKEIKLAFVQINKHMFEGKLAEPVFVVQSSKRAKVNAMGWFTVGKDWVDKETGEWFHEITICAETLSQPLSAILEVLVHEMVHLYNSMNGIQDCSGSQYHNKKFKTAAEKCYLETNDPPHPTYGYGFTKATQKLIDFFELIGIDDEAFNVALPPAPQIIPKEYKMFVYRCDLCGHTFKTSTDLEGATHVDCGGGFVKKTT